MSFTCKPLGKLPGGDADTVNWGGFLIKHPEKQSAAPDTNPVAMNLRREILVGDRWLMLPPPALHPVCEGKRRQVSPQAA
jgi:hypothetical protein